MNAYEKLIRAQDGLVLQTPYEHLPDINRESLQAHEALTDFCHISLRRQEGLDLRRLGQKFGHKGLSLVHGPLQHMVAEGLLSENHGKWALTEAGLLVSNTVFKQLTFLPDEWAHLSPSESALP